MKKRIGKATRPNRFWPGFWYAFFIILPLVAGGEFYTCRKYLVNIPSSPRGKILEDKVLLGNKLFHREMFLENDHLGEVTDFLVDSGDLGIAGEKGVIYVDRFGNLKNVVSFAEPYRGAISFLSSKNRLRSGFLVKGSWSSPVALLDSNGHELWKYGEHGDGVDDAVAGDLDGDGGLKVAVGFNGGGGIHLLDELGKKIWNESGANIWHVELADTEGNGKLQIVHSNAGGQIIVRDKTGKILSEAKPEPYFSHFSMLHWPQKDSRRWPLTQEKERLWVLDYAGNSLATFALPQAPELAEAFATPFKLRGFDRAGLAALVSGGYGVKGSNIYFFSPDGKLLFHESLSVVLEAIVAVPEPRGMEDTVLVGGNGRVWRYRATDR